MARGWHAPFRVMEPVQYGAGTVLEEASVHGPHTAGIDNEGEAHQPRQGNAKEEGITMAGESLNAAVHAWVHTTRTRHRAQLSLCFLFR